MPGQPRPLHVSLVAIPDAVVSTLSGIYDVLGCFRMMAGIQPSIPDEPPSRRRDSFRLQWQRASGERRPG